MPRLLLVAWFSDVLWTWKHYCANDSNDLTVYLGQLWWLWVKLTRWFFRPDWIFHESQVWRLVLKVLMIDQHEQSTFRSLKGYLIKELSTPSGVTVSQITHQANPPYNTLLFSCFVFKHLLISLLNPSAKKFEIFYAGQIFWNSLELAESLKFADMDRLKGGSWHIGEGGV